MPCCQKAAHQGTHAATTWPCDDARSGAFWYSPAMKHTPRLEWRPATMDLTDNQLYGPSATGHSAKKWLMYAAREHRLCDHQLGFSRPRTVGEPCFARQVGRCHGVCRRAWKAVHSMVIACVQRWSRCAFLSGPSMPRSYSRNVIPPTTVPETCLPSIAGARCPAAHACRSMATSSTFAAHDPGRPARVPPACLRRHSSFSLASTTSRFQPL